MEELCSVVNCTPSQQPVLPDVRATDMELRLGHNLCYVVAAVVIQDDKALLIQEAKPSCRGLWYLPAGRMERNESISEAVKREVLEESGFEFEPEALVAVECHSHYWVRFTLTGKVTGGSLKTTAEADKESLQAGWFPVEEVLAQRSVDLRAPDILPLIRTGKHWFKTHAFTGLPVLVGHVSSSQRLVCIHDDGDKLRLLVTKQATSSRMPVNFIDESMDILVNNFGYKGRYKDCGLLSVEHLGNPRGQYDGFCATFLLQFHSLELAGGDCEWMVVSDDDLTGKLRKAMSEGGTATFTRI